MPSLNTGVSYETWDQAEKYFASKKNQKKVKLKIPDPENPAQSISFICVAGQVYIKQTRDFLGKGGFGKVQLIETRDNKQFAIKIEGRGARSENDAELQVLNLLRSYHGQAERKLKEKTNFLGSDTKQKLYTVMNLAEGKDLSKFLKDNANPSNTYVDYADRYAEVEPTPSAKNQNNTQELEIAFSCIQTLHQLHSNNVVHGDVKPANFMVNLKGEMISVAAIDFGLSLKVQPGSTSASFVDNKPRGTPGYTAPEITFPRGRENTPAKDIATEKASKMEYDKSKTERTMSYASDIYSLGVMFKEDLKLPPKFYEQMLKSNPSERPTSNELMKILAQALAQNLKESKTSELKSEETSKPPIVSMYNQMKENTKQDKSALKEKETAEPKVSSTRKFNQ